jgi:hypothetical protein
MNGRDRDAEMALIMALKLLGAESANNAELVERLRAKCYADTQLRNAVAIYLASSPSYAPKARHKLDTELVRVVS